ncbi:MAG: BadF/BadG/BcrA/BcrD ATPase family protein [Pseudomonadota bacterium]
MPENIYIGVDGGATKCKARIEDETGNLIGQAVGGLANIRLSVETSWRSIYESIETILIAQNISLHDKNYRFHLALGLAGCEVQQARHAFLAVPHPFASLYLTSDAHVACVGAHSGGDGAIIIVGTGVVGYQVHGAKTNSVGGWGFPHDDEGGGAWLGLEVTRLTFQWLDGRGIASPLLEEVFAYFKNDLNDFATWANTATSNEFARLAPLVINHSLQQDVMAHKLMRQAAQAVDSVAAALEKLHPENSQPLPCCLFGGIAPFIEPWLAPDLQTRLTPRQGDANSGAILMARELLTEKQI